MGGGGIKDTQNQEKAIADEQQATAHEQLGFAQQRLARGDALEQPLINYLSKVIGGNSLATHQALATPLSNITASAAQNKANIYNTVPAGAARDYALAANHINTGNQVASLTNSTFMSAFPTLAQLSGAQYSTGLQQTGAGITSESNAATTTGNVLQSQNAQKASTLGLVGSLAGTAGSVATAGLSKGGAWNK